MFQNSLFPLRTIVGDAVPIENVSNIRKVFESEESRNSRIEYEFSLKPSITDTVEDPHYSRYLPRFTVNGQIILPGEGMDRLPAPPAPLSFANNAEVISFFALAQDEVTTDVSRKLSVRFSIKLPEEFLVGGICFGGFPYLPYSRIKTVSAGENSSNFGLPREIRLTCLGRSGDTKGSSPFDQFLDAEISATRQEIVSHSGLHYLCIDPTLTDSLTVYFSDYPTILREVQVGRRKNGKSGKKVKNEVESKESYGFIIPYFYVFEYQEKTRYRPTVSAGILGTTTNNIDPDNGDILKKVIDHKYIVSNLDLGNLGNYFDFTAASIFGQQRDYIIRDAFYDGENSKGQEQERLEECFISQKIEPGKKVVLYIEQGEEYERCIAGLKAYFPFIPEISLEEDVEKFSAQIRELFPNSQVDFSGLLDNVPREDLENYLRQLIKIPQDIDFCEKIGIKVYELDPVEGISPLKVELDSKYATLLSESVIDELSEIYLALFLEGIRFVRPSNSRYFAIELTNLDDKAGQFVIKSLRLIQSAHVSVHPRAAKTQQVRTLNFRIIGANLAEDYALLGDEGFNFSIERFVAGERKSVLFRANSLMDLLHTGAAKIFSNVRRRAVEFEMVENFREVKGQQEAYQVKKFDQDNFAGTNFENRETDNNNISWRSIESGKDVSWSMDKGIPNFEEFENYSGSEIRSRNEQISSLLDPSFDSFENLRNQLQTLIGDLAGGSLMDFSTASNNVFRNQTNNGFGGIWKPFQKFGFNQNNLPSLQGYQTLNIPPYFLNILDSIDTILSTISLDISSLDFDTSLSIRSAAIDDLIAKLALVNGVSIGLSGGVGASLSEAAVVALALAGVPIPLIPSLSAGASLSINSNLTTALRSSTNGAVGSIAQSGQELKYSLNRSKQEGYDNNISHTEANEAEQKRIVTRRELLNRDKERVRGAEVMWQGELVDIITGAIPLNFTLPATASKMHFRTSDDSLRVRFGSGVGTSLSVDFWFDLTEEIVKDDY